MAFKLDYAEVKPERANARRRQKRRSRKSKPHNCVQVVATDSSDEDLDTSVSWVDEIEARSYHAHAPVISPPAVSHTVPREIMGNTVVSGPEP